MRAPASHLLIGALVCVAAACGSPESDAPVLPWPAALLGAAPEPADNPSTDAKQELGRMLFYDPILSADRDTACATCHSEIWGMSDGLALSIGTGGDSLTGPGRQGPRATRRNAQTLWNVAYRETLFWDGRASSLEEQALLPIAEPLELGREPEALARELSTIEAYADAFADAFPEAEGRVTPAAIGKALAAFQRTLRSDRAPYDRYVAGDERALDDASLRGMWLFDEAGCATCHSAPRFESERFANRRVEPSAPAGVADTGRHEVTGEAADLGSFRVPTLRNLRETGPYFHAGQVTTLREAVQHELAVQYADGASRRLAPDEIDDLNAFIEKGLMDRSREPDRPEYVPSGLPVPIDGFRIPR